MIRFGRDEKFYEIIEEIKSNDRIFYKVFNALKNDDLSEAVKFINPLPENPILQGGDVEARNQIVQYIIQLLKYGDFH